MKKFFTLLFCVAAMGFAASANEAPNVNDCINTLLSGNQATTLRGVNLDFNNDGIVSIADVTAIIDYNLMVQEQINRAPAASNEAINKRGTVIEGKLKSINGEIGIKDVPETTDKNIK